jgi:hypothetical protein
MTATEIGNMEFASDRHLNNKFVVPLQRNPTRRWTGARIARSSTCSLLSMLLLIAAPGQRERWALL